MSDAAFASIEDALRAAGASGVLDSDLAKALDDNGYVVLRGAIPADRIEALRDTFERTYLAPELWPQPREHGTRHAMLDEESDVHAVCLLPLVLHCVYHILGRRFFLGNVQGRDPLPGGGYQALHRDWLTPEQPMPYVTGLAFLDPFGPQNGATRIIPGSHCIDDDSAFTAPTLTHPQEVILEGDPGDFLLFNGRLVHSGTRNAGGATRRALQLDFRAWHVADTIQPERDYARMPPLTRYFLGEDLLGKSRQG